MQGIDINDFLKTGSISIKGHNIGMLIKISATTWTKHTHNIYI